MRIHIVSIAGTMTAYLAKALKKQGHIVSGSDQEQIFPPISTIIEESTIHVGTEAPQVCPVCGHPQAFFSQHGETLL